MLSKSERHDYKYKVRFVDKTKEVNGKPITKFVISDKVKGTTNEYIDYYVTVFDVIDIKDGDYIRLLDFDNVTASYYEKKNKINFFMSAIVQIVHDHARNKVDSPFE